MGIDTGAVRKGTGLLMKETRKDQCDTKIICGDTLSECEKMPNDFFNLIITSPPYNIGKKYEETKTIEDYLDEQSVVISELKRVLKPTGSICWQVGNHVNKGEVFPLDIYFYEIFKSLEMKLRNRIVWHFGHGLHAKNRFSGRYETMLWFTKSDDYVFNLDPVRVPSKYPNKKHYKGPKKGQLSGNPLGKNPSDFWSILQEDFDSCVWNIPNVKFNHPEKIKEHPCQFPVELVERCVLSMTNENDWVLDPYGGVGSTAIAAVKNSRHAVSIDRDTEFSNIAEHRLKSFHNGEIKTRPIEKPIYSQKKERIFE